MTERGIQPVVGASLVLWHSDLDQVVAAVQSVMAQDLPIASLAVIVNDDPDGVVSRDVEQRLRPLVGDADLAIRPVSHNSGFAGGHDLALDLLFAAQCDYVLVLNPDVFLDPACTGRLVAHAEQQAVPTLVGPLLERAATDRSGDGTIDTTGIRWTWSGRHLDALQGRLVRAAPSHPTLVAGVSGACLLVSRAAYERLVSLTGEFFDADFIAYREDAELAIRASLLGVESWIEPRAMAVHVRSLRGTSRKTTPWINSLGVRNRFLIAAKYGLRRPGIWPFPWLRDIVVVLGVICWERESLPGLADAWRLRRRMRAKGKRVLRVHGGIA